MRVEITEHAGMKSIWGKAVLAVHLALAVSMNSVLSSGPGGIADSIDLGDDWAWSAWFGTHYTGFAPWLYHEDLGWVYCVNDGDGIWLATDDLGWAWTSPESAPAFYVLNRGGWFWFATEEGAAFASLGDPDDGSVYKGGYQIQTAKTEEGRAEWHGYLGTQHFVSVYVAEKGGFTLRPHPGADPDGWGTTVYFHPKFASGDFLDGMVETVRATRDGIRVRASGKIAGGEGDWEFEMVLTHDNVAKRSEGTGSLKLSLEDVPAGNADLDLLRVASNFLLDVPLSNGQSGPTPGTWIGCSLRVTAFR